MKSPNEKRRVKMNSRKSAVGCVISLRKRRSTLGSHVGAEMKKKKKMKQRKKTKKKNKLSFAVVTVVSDS